MKFARLILPVFAAAVTLALAGCGAAGLTNLGLEDPNAGTYDGTFTTSGGQHGTLHVVITNAGAVSGSLVNQSTTLTATLSGSLDTSVANDGDLSIAYSSFTDVASGNLALDNTNQFLIGTDSLSNIAGSLGTISFQLTRD